MHTMKGLDEMGGERFTTQQLAYHMSRFGVLGVWGRESVCVWCCRGGREVRRRKEEKKKERKKKGSEKRMIELRLESKSAKKNAFAQSLSLLYSFSLFFSASSSSFVFFFATADYKEARPESPSSDEERKVHRHAKSSIRESAQDSDDDY